MSSKLLSNGGGNCALLLEELECRAAVLVVWHGHGKVGDYASRLGGVVGPVEPVGVQRVWGFRLKEKRA